MRFVADAQVRDPAGVAQVLEAADRRQSAGRVAGVFAMIKPQLGYDFGGDQQVRGEAVFGW